MKIIQKNTKKLIIALIVLILFSFCCPTSVKARGFLGIDIPGAIAGLFYWVERGILGLFNDIFCDEDHKYIYNVADMGDDIQVTTQIYFTPEAIIKGKFLLFNANIFEDPRNSDEEYYDSGQIPGATATETGEGGIVSGRNELRKVVSSWYNALLTFTVVALLSVLVYVGIRMIISTMASDKAKYKTMFKDWLVAICLAVMMHYIMIATLNISGLVVKSIGSSGNARSHTEKIMVLLENILADKDEGEGEDSWDERKRSETRYYEEETGRYYTIGDAFAYEFLLAAIIGYTVIFAIKYLKREFTIICLILLGPISCITYPIDKIGDGKAQAFNKWLAEFVYNVIIQPFHLLIYIVLVGSAVELANSNVLYSIICFAIMIPAEKFIKEMFGFKDKLGSPLSAMTTGSMAGQLMNKMRGGSSSSSNDQKTKVPVKNDNNNIINENKRNPGLPGSSNTDGGSSGNSSEGGNQTETGNPQQAMQDAYDEGDAYERANNPIEGMNYSAEEYEQRLRESDPDATDEEIAQMMADAGYGENNREDRVEESLEAARQQEEAASLANEIENRQREQNQDEQNNLNDRGEINAPNNQGIYSPTNPDKKSRFMNVARGMREHRDKVLLANYGTKNRGAVLGLFVGKKAVGMAAGAGKKAIKGATTLAGAAALGTFGFMFGQSSKAAMAGASWGADKGTAINKKLSSGWSSVKDYSSLAYNAFKNDNEETRRKNAVKEMMKSPEQIDRASHSFSKRNNGRIASTRELDDELANRAKFKEMKLSDDQIDDAIQIYEDNKDILGEEEATQLAYASAMLSGKYSAKEFEDEKKMSNAYNSLMGEYDALGVNKDLADEKVREIIMNASKLQGVSRPALKIPSRKQEYFNQNKDNAIVSHTTAQLQQELEMGYNLRKAGISETNRQEFFNNYLNNTNAREEARQTIGDGATDSQIDLELERRFEIKVKIGMTDKNEKADEQQITQYIQDAEEFIKTEKNISNPTNAQVRTEVVERVTTQDAYQVTGGTREEISQEVTKIRKSENAFINKSNDKEGAKLLIKTQRRKAKENENNQDSKTLVSQAKYEREFLNSYTKSEMQDSKLMEKAAKKIEKKAKKDGVIVKSGTLGDFAQAVIDNGKHYAGVKDN